MRHHTIATGTVPTHPHIIANILQGRHEIGFQKKGLKEQTKISQLYRTDKRSLIDPKQSRMLPPSKLPQITTHDYPAFA